MWARALLLAAPVALVLSAAAHADAFGGCDGYPEPTAEGDGMTSGAPPLVVLGPPGQEAPQSRRTELGPIGIGDCDVALAALPAKYWKRRASLLQARAIHRMETTNGAAAAMVDLDLADRAGEGQDDPYYERSLGLGISLVRAYALRQMGEPAQAESYAMRTLARRPFDWPTNVSAVLAMGPSASDDNVEKAVQGMARLSPYSIDVLFRQAVREGRYEEMIALYPQLVPSEQFGDPDSSRQAKAELEERNRADTEIFWARRASVCAYALAATGRGAEARAMIESARERLARAVQDPGQRTQYPRELVLSANQRIAASAGPLIDQWAAQVELRAMLSEDRFGEVIIALPRLKPVDDWPSVELFNTLAARLPFIAPSASARAKSLQQDMSARADRPEHDLQVLWTSLPAPEAADRIPPYRKAQRALNLFGGGGSDFGQDGDGFTEFAQADKGLTIVRFRSYEGDASTASEMALLRAADLALQAGRPGFIVVARQDAEFTVTKNRPTDLQGRRTLGDGYETEFQVAFVDPAALPAAYKDASWRVIDAASVHAALAPIYQAAPAKKAS